MATEEHAEHLNVVQEAVPPFGHLQLRPMGPAERQAALDREVAVHRANIEKDLKESDHRRRIDFMGFSVLVIVLMVGFVCGLLPPAMVGDQKWAQSIASAVLGLLIGRYTVTRKH